MAARFGPRRAGGGESLRAGTHCRYPSSALLSALLVLFYAKCWELPVFRRVNANRPPRLAVLGRCWVAALLPHSRQATQRRANSGPVLGRVGEVGQNANQRGNAQRGAKAPCLDRFHRASQTIFRTTRAQAAGAWVRTLAHVGPFGGGWAEGSSRKTRPRRGASWATWADNVARATAERPGRMFRDPPSQIGLLFPS